MRYADVSALYAAVGEGQVSANTVVHRLVQSMGGEGGTTEDLAEVARPGVGTSRRPRTGDPGIVVKGVEDVWVKLAKCCTPVPGDALIGFITRGQGVSVHRTDCANVAALQSQPERFVEVDQNEVGEHRRKRAALRQPVGVAESAIRRPRRTRT